MSQQRSNGAVTAAIPDLKGQLSAWSPRRDCDRLHLTSVPPSIVGLDTSRAPARMVVTTLDDREGRIIPQVTTEVTFHSLMEFTGFWEGEELAGLRIAVPAEGADPLSIRAWLHTQGQALESYEWTAYRTHITATDLREMDLDEVYARPYALALYACYRLNAAAVARGLWAKLFEVHYLLEEVRQEAHRLAASLPEAEPWPWSLDPPF